MNLSKLRVVDLKEILRVLNLPSSGNKPELLLRLAEVEEAAVVAVCESLGITDPQDDDNEQNNLVTELKEMVEQLTNEVQRLRTASSATPNSMPVAIPTLVGTTTAVASTPIMVTTTITDTLPTCRNVSVSDIGSMSSGQLYAQSCARPGQGNIMLIPQPTVMSVGQSVPVGVMPDRYVYSSQPTRTLRNDEVPRWTVPPLQHNDNFMHPSSAWTYGRQRATVASAPPNVYASTPANTFLTTQPGVQHHSVKDIATILPTFDPSDETYSSTQFVERIEQLKDVYAWDDAVLVFAVMTKFRGVAKRWADAQPVFRSWAEFVVAFLTDFPHVSDLAGVHITMMQAKMGRNEKFVEFYYRMLALGRRENIDDASIVRYIINGLYDVDIKRSLSAMNFKKCSDLLKSFQNISAVCYKDHSGHKRSWENFKNEKPIDKQENRHENKTYEQNKSKNNNNIICFKCRQRGHVAKNCTQVRRIRVNVQEVETAANEIVTEEAEINEVKVKKHNELLKTVSIGEKPMIVCDALIDSGSSKSLIRKKVATKLETDLIDCYEKLFGFAGGETVCKQKMQTVLKIDDVTKQVEFLVVDDQLMSHDALIGLDGLAQARVIIENGSCKVMTIKNNELSIGDLSHDMLTKFSELVEKYEGCFGEELEELGKAKNFKMNISLTSTKPVYRKPYNIPIPKRKVVEDMIEKLLKLEIIRPSTSLYASPIVLVRKQNGEDRMCIDFRQLNSITEQQPWCMPTVDAVLCKLSGHQFFTTLDLMSGYYQIEVEEACKHLTAFVTHKGHYEFNRMPFGLRNAPCTFQRMMSKLIEPLGDKIASYVDEIIIATDTADENLSVLEEFLAIVKNEGLTLRITKCSFLKASVSFLGHVVDAAGVRPGTEKTDDIRKFPVPKNLQEVRRFLGLSGFFRKFVLNYAQIAKPLTSLMKKDAPFVWSNECSNAFETLINALTTSPVLAIYNVNKNHQLHTDASSIGIAAILMQQNDSGNWQAVAYYSRCCNEAERKYHAYELEVLAVVEACDRFRMYLLGKSFEIISDCQSISTAKLTKPMVPRVARWLLRLQEYDFQLIHRAGDSMRHVDAMSRAPNSANKDREQLNHVVSLETHDWVSLMQQADEKLKLIMDVLAGRTTHEQKKQMESQYMVKKHRLFYKLADSKLALVVPKGMRWRIVKLYHDDIGHPALETVLKQMTMNFWFPRMRNYVKSYLKSCFECAYHRKPHKTACELYGMEVPTLPFQVLHLDHLGPFVKSKRGNEYVLVCVDALTRYTMIHATKSTKTKPVIDALNMMTLFFGLPQTIVTDRGTAFTSAAFANFCDEHSIKHIKVAVRTPRSNGLAERVNQSVLTYLKTATSDPREWDNQLRMLQWMQNTKVNSTTKFAPLDLIFDFSLRDINGNKLVAALHDDTELIMNNRRESAAKHIENARIKWKQRFDAKHIKPYKYEEGDLVLVEAPMAATGESRKLQAAYKGPYVVKKALRFDRYIVEDLAENQRNQRKYSAVVASDKMKKWCALIPELDDDIDMDTTSEDELEAS